MTDLTKTIDTEKSTSVAADKIPTADTAPDKDVTVNISRAPDLGVTPNISKVVVSVKTTKKSKSMSPQKTPARMSSKNAEDSQSADSLASSIPEEWMSSSELVKVRKRGKNKPPKESPKKKTPGDIILTYLLIYDGSVMLCTDELQCVFVYVLFNMVIQ